MAEETKVETMEDYAAELEASFKKVRTGDNLTGVIIDVTDEKIVVDLKYYAEGIILKEDINADPDYSLKAELSLIHISMCIRDRIQALRGAGVLVGSHLPDSDPSRRVALRFRVLGRHLYGRQEPLHALGPGDGDSSSAGEALRAHCAGTG